MPGDGWGLIHFDQLTTFLIYISEYFSRGNQSNEWDVFLFGLYWAILAVVVIELWISMTYELGTPPVQCDETAGFWEGVRSEQKTGFNWNLRGNISTSMVNIVNLHTSLAKLIIFQTKKRTWASKTSCQDFGAASCKRCTVGSYQNVTGQSLCKTCPEKRTTVGLGAESLAECVSRWKKDFVFQF